MNEPYKGIRQRRKIGQGFLEEEPTEENPMGELVEEIEDPTEAVKEKIGMEPMQEETIVLRPLRKSFRTIRKRKKIGGELIEKGLEEQKAKVKKQINELPKEHRKAFLEALLKKM